MSLRNQGTPTYSKTSYLREVSSAKRFKGQEKLLTTKSSWTPLTPHGELNEKLFNERKELVVNWFEKWNDRQRKTVLDLLLVKCKSSQINFLYDIIQPQMPRPHVDFSKILPRYLTLRIFSLLDPRTLSHSGQVSWHWKYLSEHDYIWMPKCLKLGWYLNFPVSPFETGVWKRLYINCVEDLRRGVIPCLEPILDESSEEEVDEERNQTLEKETEGCHIDVLTNSTEDSDEKVVVEKTERSLMRPTISSLMKSKSNATQPLIENQMQVRLKTSLKRVKRNDLQNKKRDDSISRAEVAEILETQGNPNYNGTEILTASSQRPKWAKLIPPSSKGYRQEKERNDISNVKARGDTKFRTRPWIMKELRTESD